MGWRLKKDYNNSDNWYFFKITDHGKNKKTGKIERDEDPLSEEEIVECGFDLEWNYSQALEFYDNTFKPNQKILKIESKINAHKRVSRRKFKKSIFLPPHLVKKFYNDFLLEKYPSPEKKNKDDKTKKLLKGYDGYWNTAQDVIAEVCVKPEDYFMKPAKFYLYAIPATSKRAKLKVAG